MRIQGMENTQRRLMRTICRASIVCCVLILGLMIAMACSGSLAAVQSRQVYLLDDAVREVAVKAFARMSGWHVTMAFLLLVAALTLGALSVWFGLQLSHVESKRKRFRWMQAIRAGALFLVLLANAILGKVYLNNLEKMNYWLTPPAGGFADDAVVAKGAGSAATFSTFVAFHGILLPVLAVLLIIFMWPSFYEFVPSQEIEAQSKWRDITRPREF